MKDFRIKLAGALGASLAAYFVVGVGIFSAIAPFWRAADIEILIPGALILIGTTLLWLSLLGRYPFCRRRSATAIFLLFGLGITVFASIIYPVLRIGALWKDLGKPGGAALVMVIVLSLASQLGGFIAGFVPSALFVRYFIRSYQAVGDLHTTRHIKTT
jgi:hypothetical protein